MTDEDKRAKRAAYMRVYMRSYYQANRETVLAGQRAYLRSPKGRATVRKRKFGISPEDYEKLFERQGHKCAICFTEETGSKNEWHTDHCHSTGVVRGVLCHHCNVMLGMAKDSTETLTNAINYLTTSRAESLH